MVEIRIRNITYDYKDKSSPYYGILRDLKRHIQSGYYGYFELYGSSKNDKLEGVLTKYHKELDDIIKILNTAMEKEGVEKTNKLFIKINELKKFSNFDWSNFKKLERFLKLFDRYTREIKRLP